MGTLESHHFRNGSLFNDIEENSIPPLGTILLRAHALRRIAALEIAKQDALRRLGGEGLLKSGSSHAFTNKRLW
jgi:hypothetical protein